MAVRDDLQQILDERSDDEVDVLKRVAVYLRSWENDPLLWFLATAPVDDEPSTPEEEGSAEVAWQACLSSGGTSLEDAGRWLLG